MKILYITPFFNLPPTDGASLRSVRLFEQLRKSNKVHVLTYDNGQQIDKYYNKLDITYFHSSFRNTAKKTYFRRLFSKSLPGLASHDKRLIAEDINALILKNGDYDLYYFCTQLIGQSIFLSTINGPCVIDLYDIYTNYSKSRYINISYFRPHFWLLLAESIRIRIFEKKLLNQFKYIVVTSDNDLNQLKKFSLSSKIIVIPNGIDLIKNNINNYKKEKSLLMIGNFSYSANSEGLLWFYKEVWPILLDKIKELRLYVIGKNNKFLINVLSNEKNIVLTGVVEDLSQYYSKVSCSIVPIFNDGGTKTKLIEALAYGIPVVTTSMASKSFQQYETVYIADKPKSFANSIFTILNQTINDQSINEIKENIFKKYSWGEIGKKIDKFLIDIN